MPFHINPTARKVSNIPDFDPSPGPFLQVDGSLMDVASFLTKPGIGPTTDGASERLSLGDFRVVFRYCGGAVCARPSADFLTAKERAPTATDMATVRAYDSSILSGNPITLRYEIQAIMLTLPYTFHFHSFYICVYHGILPLANYFETLSYYSMTG